MNIVFALMSSGALAGSAEAVGKAVLSIV